MASAQTTSLFAHRRSHNALDEQAPGGTANCWLLAGQRICSARSAAAGPLVQRQKWRQGPNAWAKGHLRERAQIQEECGPGRPASRSPWIAKRFDIIYIV